jgi:hypothetical protein
MLKGIEDLSKGIELKKENFNPPYLRRLMSFELLKGDKFI